MDFTAFYRSSPIMAPLVMFAAMFGMLFVVSALRNSAWGVAAVLGFTFVSGLMLAPILQYAGGLRNGGQLVALAGGLTAAVFFVMASIATVTKRDFSFMGKFLFVGLILLIVASIANLFLQLPVLTVAVSAIAVLIFSMYLLHDLSQIVTGGQTNYIMATIAIFLDIFNIFVNLLNLLLILNGQRD
jgi:FtsH-binding integral membrane protein